jgi:sortase A
VAVTGCLCLVAGLAIGAHIALFYRHSHLVGTALILQEERVAAASRAAGHCTDDLPADPSGIPGGAVPVPDPAVGTGDPTTGTAAAPEPDALLTASSIGLVAPIVQGTGDPELDVAVGHVPASSWPGTTGTTVLAAHDVTWFSGIDQLATGDRISIATACTTYDYTVASHRIVPAGSEIDQTSTPQLVLTTCYPTDALFLTSQRYVLYASLTQVIGRGGPVTTAAPPPVPTVPAPPALIAQGLDLAHNPAPLGSLTLTGTPSATWRQSVAPLDDETALLALYFAALRSASQDQPTWWADVAPGVPFSDASSLTGATVTFNATTFDPTLAVTGDTLTGASLTTMPTLAGNRRPGGYRIDVRAGVVAGQLVVTGWTVTPR